MMKVSDIRGGLFFHGLPMACAVIILMLSWLCRAEPHYPEIGNGAMFRVRATAEHDGMADIIIHKTAYAERSAMNTHAVNACDVYLGDGAFFSSQKQSRFSVSSPRVPGAIGHNKRGTVAGSSGVFERDGLSSFSEINLEPDTKSWGWLSDDVNKSKLTADGNNSLNHSGRNEHRLLNDDGDFRSGFRSGSSSQDSFFYHQDRRWLEK
jgi:hypothetical protein